MGVLGVGGSLLLVLCRPVIMGFDGHIRLSASMVGVTIRMLAECDRV